MSRFFCTLPYGRVSAAALIIIGATGMAAFGQGQRRAAGIIYFTNNTPEDLRTFPIEILSGANKRLATAYPDEHFRFAFAGLRPGKYILRLTWPKRCVLSYRLNLSKQSMEQIRIIMDAECAHHNGDIRDLPPS
ncbi:MAG TPA: hypothetical protein VHQ64_12230 [Pyrinomonadaceae bacterium]|jgi:hypothetical protein|nr:hypothetical protein [Pyrinomonadaceae bacterium]